MPLPSDIAASWRGWLLPGRMLVLISLPEIKRRKIRRCLLRLAGKSARLRRRTVIGTGTTGARGRIAGHLATHSEKYLRRQFDGPCFSSCRPFAHSCRIAVRGSTLDARLAGM